ncbi:MAG: hypothetical protein HYV03_00370 [Deltaproteobacteria bacterium]|nr:hypothetical protein [Deltaproteobacteria bacterium]
MGWRTINGILVTVTVSLAVGCGAVTDVGNPTLEQIVGIFQKPSSVNSGGDTEPSALQSGTTCRSDDAKTKQIMATDTANQARFVNFLSYSDSTADVTATYTASTGGISFSVNDATAALSCQGSATSSGGTITVTLTCDVSTPTQETCSITYVKAN